MLYNFTFVCFVEVDRAFLPHRVGRSIPLHLRRGYRFHWIIITMQNYNLDNYFQTAFLSRGDVIFASPYMAVVKPLLVTILKLVILKDSNQQITSVVIL